MRLRLGITGGQNVGNVPQTPTNLSGELGYVGPTASPANVALTWNIPIDTGSGLTDYLLERSSDNLTWTTISKPQSTTASYLVSSLTEGLTVYFRVAARNSVGDSPFSQSIVRTTPTTKARGGQSIGYKNGIFYHTYQGGGFGSGSFVPLSPILVSALLVAGGYDGQNATTVRSGDGGAGGKVVTGSAIISTTRIVDVGDKNGGRSSISGWLTASGVGLAGGLGRTTQGNGGDGVDGITAMAYWGDGSTFVYGSSGGGGGFSDSGLARGGAPGRNAGTGGFAYAPTAYVTDGWQAAWPVYSGAGGGGGATASGVASSLGGSGAGGVVVISYSASP